MEFNGKKLLTCIITLFLFFTGFTQSDTFAFARKSEFMIPMRDGIKLHTVIVTPVDAKSPLPILIQRTPYGAFPNRMANDSNISVNWFGSNYGGLLKAGYIFVLQDIR